MQNEKYIISGLFLDTEETSEQLPDYKIVDVILHGEEYNTVKDYVEELGSSIEKNLTLIDYNVSKEDFISIYNKHRKVGSEAAFVHQFELNEKPGGLSDCSGFLKAYTLSQYGFSSCKEIEKLYKKYRKAGIKNFSFSTGSQVPVHFFLKHLPTFQNETSSRQDYFISALYNKKQGKRVLEEAGLNKKIIMTKLKEEYGVEDFNTVLPHVLLNISQTILNPQEASSKPLAIYVRTKEISEGTHSDKRLLSSLSKSHNIILVQVENSTELNTILKRIKETFPLADLLVMGSHGSSWGMEFIRIEDTESFELISQVLKPEATIFLSSCNTAKRTRHLPNGPFAYVLSNALPERTVIAAKYATYGQYLKYNPSAQDTSRRYTAFMRRTPIAIIKNGEEQDFTK
jgi:hypothetical protein